jgi:hypothetical protein
MNSDEFATGRSAGPLLAAHVVDIGADAIAVAEIFARQCFVAAYDGLGPSEIDDDVAVFDALDDAVHDLADAVLILVKLPLALGLAHLLHDHLLGVLRRHAAEIERRQRLGDEVADLRRGVAAARLLERNLRRLHGHLLDHFQETREPDLAGLGIDLGLDLVLAAIARLGGLLDRVFHGHDHHLAIDRLLARDRVRDLQELQPVGADACLSHLFLPPLKSQHERDRCPAKFLYCAFFAVRSARTASSPATSFASLNQREGDADRLRLVFARELDAEQRLAFSDAFDPTSEPLPAADQLLQLYLRLMTGPRREIAWPHRVAGRCPASRPRAGKPPGIGSSASSSGESLRLIVAQSSMVILTVRPVRHHLHRSAVTARNLYPHQAEAKFTKHRLGEIGDLPFCATFRGEAAISA